MAETPNNRKSRINSRDDSKAKDSGVFVSELARLTILFAFGAIAILGLCAILLAAAPGIIYIAQRQGSINDIKDSFSNIKDIIGILLPVMSAWAGTVFAFYFSRENFKAGTESSAALVRQLSPEEKLKSTLVKDVMIKIEDADKLILEKDTKDINIKTDIIDAILIKKNRERLPILDTEGHITYMAHRSLFDKFIAQKAEEGKKVADLTLKDMLGDKNFGQILKESFSTLQETSSLSEAKTLMEKIEKCSDIFATEDGWKTSKVTGWVTDVIVRQAATV